MSDWSPIALRNAGQMQQPNPRLRPLLEADKAPARIEIRRALKTLQSAVNDYVQNARLAPAA